MLMYRENETIVQRSQRLQNRWEYYKSRNPWKDLICKTLQNYICTSKCRYKARTAVTPVLFGYYNPTFTNEELVI